MDDVIPDVGDDVLDRSHKMLLRKPRARAVPP